MTGFSGIHHVAAVCSIPRQNDFLGPPKSVHNPNGISIASAVFAGPPNIFSPIPNPQLKRHVDRFSHFCTAQAEYSRACPGMSFPENSPFPWSDLGPTPQTHLARFSRFAGPPNMDRSIVFARWRQCAPHVTHGSFHPGPQPKRHSIGSAIFAQLTAECRQT